MTLEEIIKKLQGFNCEALKDKEVMHCFVSSNCYGYKEAIKDVVYDTKNNMFHLVTDKPVECNWDNEKMIKF
ncbi:MAG: hypothetical protein II670_00960 [Alphaproteobacteria bacterium]|nr:hypothetical protein [Alphaproteobacteria bacterium]